MSRRRDEDAETHPHARALDRSEGSADAIFRSFVQRASAPGAQLRVPDDRTRSPSSADLAADSTPDEGLDLDGTDPDLADATDPRIPMRWAETVELLLEQGLSELQTDAQEGVVLLTTRKTAPPDTQAPFDARTVSFGPDDVRTVSTSEVKTMPPPPGIVPPSMVATRIDHDRTVAMQAQELAARLRAAAPAPEPIAPPQSPRPASRPPAAKEAEPWESVVRAPSETTQKREALRLVPDVAQVEIPAPPPHERSEDGLIPSGVLDRTLSDMAVLLRYGHEAQVRKELEQLRSRYAQDLLLARRIAEFYLANHRPALALEQLFSLASGLFERRNVEGMRQALEQVLVIDPRNERASRLLSLLDQRPAATGIAPSSRKRP
ncbi:MAG: hypothetical protein OHK0013_34710 [Sandaracinaceae bacterium]